MDEPGRLQSPADCVDRQVQRHRIDAPLGADKLVKASGIAQRAFGDWATAVAAGAAITDVFVSYKREDELRVVRLVTALEKVGLKVWWDSGLPSGESWRANIQAALDGARCVVVVWTHASVGPAGDFVRDEAGRAKARGALVPVILERGVRPPLGFGELQAVDLSHWRSDARDPFFLDLVSACRAKLEGRAAPPARGARSRLLRRVTFGGVVSAVLAGGVGFAANAFSVQDQLCSLSMGQPGLSDTCGAVGLGNRPTREARLAFEALPPQDCDALQDFRDRHESSPLRVIADSRLNARKELQEEVWRPGQRRLTLYASGADEAAARAKALAQAQGLCSAFAATTGFRVVKAQANGGYACADGVCAVTGEAVCDLEERHVVKYSRCGAVP